MKTKKQKEKRKKSKLGRPADFQKGQYKAQKGLKFYFLCYYLYKSIKYQHNKK